MNPVNKSNNSNSVASTLSNDSEALRQTATLTDNAIDNLVSLWNKMSNTKLEKATDGTKKRRGIGVIHKGKSYSSQRALSESVGIPYNILNKYLKKFGPDAADMVIEKLRLGRSGDILDELIYQGQKYPSKAALARAFNVSHSALCRDINAGFTVDEAMENRKGRAIGRPSGTVKI